MFSDESDLADFDISQNPVTTCIQDKRQIIEQYVLLKKTMANYQLFACSVFKRSDTSAGL
jgi:hypothetical protein